jgi:class 3 adenylate cyclase/CHASE2 domain-containing sensor protein
MLRRWPRYRVATTLACALVASVAAVLAGGPVAGDGLVLDVLVLARSIGFPAADDPASSPVVVIAVDGASLDSKALSDYPRTLMGPFWAQTINAVMAAGARGIGFDLIFSYNAGRLESLGFAAFSGYDRPFLQALATHGPRVVLGRTATQFPADAYVAALGDETGLGLAELSADADGVYRTVAPGRETTDGEWPGLAGALLTRSGSRMPRPVTLAPRRHLERIPTYSLVAVHECARTAPAALAAAFRDRIVLVGTTLPEEDRKLSSGRFLRPDGTPGPPLHPCGLRRLGASDTNTRTVPGVFLHAAAIEAVETGRILQFAPPGVTAAIAAIGAVLAAIVGLMSTPWRAAAWTVALAGALGAAGTAALAHDLWLPLAIPLAAVLASPPIAYVVRYVVEERTRRRIEHAFGRYLSPAVVERLAQDPGSLTLGGEVREVTVMFADLSGFTALSGTVGPDALTRLTNEYLAYIVEEVEATGGYVDKFIGDAVMAIWGAPVPDADHALHAVTCALGAVRRIGAARAQALARGERAFSVKIGLNSGDAVVGNVGTEKRYNYTAVGETVNVASRLESVPGLYSCTVVVGPKTAALAGPHLLLRELDWIKVKGGAAPIAIFEPLAPLADATGGQRDHAQRYAEALGYYRDGRFGEAAALWSALAESDDARPTSPARVMAERAAAYAKEPPSAWDGVLVLTGK